MVKAMLAACRGQQKADHDKRARSRELHTGQSVMARNLRPGAPWVPGVIVEQLGPLTYQVQVGGGLMRKRHVDYLRICSDSSNAPSTDSNTDWSIPVLPERTIESDPSNERPLIDLPSIE